MGIIFDFCVIVFCFMRKKKDPFPVTCLVCFLPVLSSGLAVPALSRFTCSTLVPSPLYFFVFNSPCSPLSWEVICFVYLFILCSGVFQFLSSSASTTFWLLDLCVRPHSSFCPCLDWFGFDPCPSLKLCVFHPIEVGGRPRSHSKSKHVRTFFALLLLLLLWGFFSSNYAKGSFFTSKLKSDIYCLQM